jgi:hypothetical protein
MSENPRTTIARDNDDRDLIERDEPPMPSQSGTSGAGPAENIGSRDELKTATGADPTPTRVRGSDKAEPRIPTRADFDG